MIEIKGSGIPLKSFIDDILYRICFADQSIIIIYDNEIIWDSNFKILYRAKEGIRNNKDKENIEWLLKRTVYGFTIDKNGVLVIYVD